MTTLIADLRRAHSQIEHEFVKRGANMTSAQFLMLIGVTENAGRSQKEIGAASGLDSSTAADVAERLETHGWIRRDVNPKDKRYLMLSLTSSGRRALIKAHVVMRNIEQSLGDCNGLRTSLNKIASIGG